MDANDAGTRHSEHCTLILTEGDSAKSLVVGGLSVAGRDRYGVFPLRGKLLNVREASASQVAANAEIQNIKQILGLQHGKVYENAKALRYGHLMIMTDQDHDGSHIKVWGGGGGGGGGEMKNKERSTKNLTSLPPVSPLHPQGLIMNFFHHFYPSLLKVPGFLLEFVTPIVKCAKGAQEVAFFTLPEYEAWRHSKSGAPGWRVKYYKGLGTSTEKEAKAYFSRIDHHRKSFVWAGHGDGAALELAFSKRHADARKTWLAEADPTAFLDHAASEITYHDFVHKELVLFSRADLERSIPSMVDGLKPGQRKILFCAFKRNLVHDVKVAQLSGYVAEHSAYHHGETSLQGTIVGLAQDFVGSNNVNLLVPSGQFGTRLMGGRDAASARYIYTRLSPITRSLFHPADDALLTYNNEEGQSIEPQWYIPLIPTVLVNGAEGIGTGWSTSVPNHDPRALVAATRALLAGEEPPKLTPWWRGFTGGVEEVAATKGASGQAFAITGRATVTPSPDGASPPSIDVTELPVRRWTQDYKEFLEGMVKPADGSPAVLADYREHHTDATVHFALAPASATAASDLASNLTAKLKLSTRVPTSNMVLFDAEGRIKRYASADAILRDFFTLRLDFYARRRAALIAAAEGDAVRATNKARFIAAVVSGGLVVGGRPKADVEAALETGGYAKLPKDARRAAVAAAAAAAAAAAPGDEGTVSDDDDDAASPATVASYDYLLTLPISSLTLEKVGALSAAAAAADAEVARLRSTTARAMYAADLDALDAALAERDEVAAEDAARLARQQARAATINAKAAAKAKAPKKKKQAWSDSEEEEVDDWSSEEEEVVPKKAVPRPRAPGKRGATASASASVVSVSAAPSAAAAPSAVAAPASPTASTAAAPPPLPPPPPPPPADGGSLLDRLAGRLGSLSVDAATLASLSPGGKQAAAVAAPAPVTAAAPAQPAKKAAAAPPARRKPQPKKAARPPSSDDDDASAGDASDWSDAPSQPAAKKAPRVPVAATQPTQSAAVSEEGAPAASGRAPRRAAAAAAAKVAKAVAVSSDEEEESEASEPSDDESDFSE